ncbi:MAG: hypothetical protein R3Y24_13870 [Eubacteriales bacterium]
MDDCKLRCIDGNGGCATTGRIYKVKNNEIKTDECKYSVDDCENIEEINRCFASQFELVKKEPLKVGDWVITKKRKKIDASLSPYCFNKMKIKKPTRIVSFLSGDARVEKEELSCYYYDPKWLKKVDAPKEKENKGENYDNSKSTKYNSN